MAEANGDYLIKDAGNDSSEGEWEEEAEDEPFIIETKCLFCGTVSDSPYNSFSHCKNVHSFDISIAKMKFNLDCFNYIKMVNYCRKYNPTPVGLMGMSSTHWDSDDFLSPVIKDDGLLQFDIDEEVEEYHANHNLPSDDKIAELEHRCSAAEIRASHAEEALKASLSDLAKMREVAQSFMVGDAANTPLVPSHESIQNLKDGDDDVYFESYGHFSIHHEMLRDSSRTKFYQDCINGSKELFKDKIVLDVGCGTGILSMFAANAGAKKVFGVEMSDVYYQAVDIIKENNLENKVHLLKGRMEDVNLPVEKVDIIISEWMGYFLLFESMLDTVLWARDKYLTEEGYVLPNKCNIKILGVQDRKIFENNIAFWDNVYGFKMSCMKTAVVREASVQQVDSSSICTEVCTLTDFNLKTTSTKDLEFKSNFELKVTEDTKITALVGFFDILWDIGFFSAICSTSPFEEATHWKQTVFFLESPLVVSKGDTLKGTLSCVKNRKDPRSLNISITLQGVTLKYCMQ